MFVLVLVSAFCGPLQEGAVRAGLGSRDNMRCVLEHFVRVTFDFIAPEEGAARGGGRVHGYNL